MQQHAMAGETVDNENLAQNAELTSVQNICTVCQKVIPFIETTVLQRNIDLCEIEINGQYDDPCFLAKDDFYTAFLKREENLFVVNVTASAYRTIHDDVVVEKLRNVSKHLMHLIIQTDASPVKDTKVFMKGPGKDVTMLDFHIPAEPMSDDYVFKILYDTIRLNNISLFHMLYDKWQPNCAEVDGTLQRLDQLLPKVYETLKLKDVPLSMGMEFAVERKLINSQFLVTDCNEENRKDVKASLDEVKSRITIVCSLIENLKHYVDKEVDKEFLLIAKFVARNIHILKRQLKSTYGVIPWEEMEFCLVNFITCQTKHQEVDVVYKLVMDKEKLLSYLRNFADELRGKMSEITEKHVNSKLPKQDQVSTSREKSSFAELRKDFYLMKNVDSLKRIELYIEVALSVDLDENPELGKLVIERTLQIIGESLKNQPESRNVSDDVHSKLLFSAPKNVREIITGLRDSLSHVYTLTKKIEFENKDVDFFLKIQNDLRKIAVDTGDILYKKKLDAVIMFLGEVSDAKDIAHVSKLVGRLGINCDFGKIYMKNLYVNEFTKVKRLVDKLENEIEDQTLGEKNAFSKMKEILQSREQRLRTEN